MSSTLVTPPLSPVDILPPPLVSVTHSWGEAAEEEEEAARVTATVRLPREVPWRLRRECMRAPR
jgi:hypothetical protein